MCKSVVQDHVRKCLSAVCVTVLQITKSHCMHDDSTKITSTLMVWTPPPAGDARGSDPGGITPVT